MLKYVENKNIDREKWDLVISNSENAYIYSTSNYLDIVSDNWDALIYGDYNVIMPLPYKKKYGIKYIMQPIFAQQLGIIYIEKPEDKILNEFVNFLKNSFIYFAINLNYDNNSNNYTKYHEKTNLILNLNYSYDKILKGFSTNTKRNIKKSQKEDFVIEKENQNNEEFLNFFVSNLVEKESEQTINILKNIINYSFKENIGTIYSVKKNDEILSSVFILKSFNRYIYLAASSNKKGKELRTMFFLLNSFIEENCDSDYILDFEGSDVDGVKRFYKGFNAVEQNYKHIFKKFF